MLCAPERQQDATTATVQARERRTQHGSQEDAPRGIRPDAKQGKHSSDEQSQAYGDKSALVWFGQSFSKPRGILFDVSKRNSLPRQLALKDDVLLLWQSSPSIDGRLDTPSFSHASTCMHPALSFQRREIFSPETTRFRSSLLCLISFLLTAL